MRMTRKTIEEIRASRDSEKVKRQLEALARTPDEDIDLSDIPEMTPEQFRRGVRGRFYRAVKDEDKPVK